MCAHCGVPDTDDTVAAEISPATRQLAATRRPRTPPEPSVPAVGTADLVLYGGRVHTQDPQHPVASAVAIAGNRVLATGTDDEVRSAAGHRARPIDLEGRTVVPGLNDSHLHQFAAAQDRVKVRLLDARSVADVVAAVAAGVAGAPRGSWVESQAGWHESLLAERRLPTRRDLDPVSRHHPVFLRRGGHVAAVNSAALRQAGIARGTPDPPGGVVVRDADGEPTGVLLERACDLVARLLPPPPTPERQAELLRAQMTELNTLGITSVTEPGLTAEQIGIYAALWGDGRLTTRTHLLWRAGDLAAVTAAAAAFPARCGDDMLRFDGLKIYTDGGVEGAYMRDPYLLVPGEQTDPTYRGMQTLPPGGAAELTEMYVRAAQHGFQVQTHAVGDAAIDFVLDILRHVDRYVPLAPLRWTMIHLQLPDTRALATMRELGLLATVQDQPVLLGANQTRWWGLERSARSVPVREILDAGIPTGAGTDAPIVSPDPFTAMGWMTTRTTLHGETLGPGQAITAAEALHLYTVGSARTQDAETAKGRVQPGMLADLAVLDGDPLAVDPREIADIGCALTVLDGRVVTGGPS